MGFNSEFCDESDEQIILYESKDNPLSVSKHQSIEEHVPWR
jgi:hypothetical protein